MTPFEERINRLAEAAVEELTAIGIKPSAQIIRIKENRRAKKRLGCCKKEKKFLTEYFIIEIAAVLHAASDQEIKEILIHELLHTCRDCFNHGKQWKSLAKRVNSAYGYHIGTYADASILNAETQDKIKPLYEIKCTQCNHIGYRQKRSKVVTHPNLYRCAKCGGPLIVRKI